MKLKTKINTILSLLIVFMALTVNPISADSYSDFTVGAVIPENQIDKGIDYFDLMMTPNKEQEIMVEIRNNGSEIMIATLDINNGTTGNNGSKQYMLDIEPDPSMTTPLTSITKIVDNYIEIGPKETKIARIKLNMPADEQDGVILGGISVIANTKDSNDKEINEGLLINNQLSYLIGLQLRTNNNEIQRNLNLVSVGTDLVDFDPSIIANIQNDMPILMNDISIVGTVTKKGTDTVVGSINQSNRAIMPNTNFNVVYGLTNGELKPGDYDIKLRIVHDKDGKSWEWEESLTIDANDAKDINNQAIFNESSTNYYMIAIIAMLVVIVILLFILLMKRRKKEDRTK